MMPTYSECICCHDISQVLTKMNQLPTPVSCITIHPGFHNVCLDFWVLQTAFYFYHQQYGRIAYHGAIHEYVGNKCLLYDTCIF